jgi:hypothetical protein
MVNSAGYRVSGVGCRVSGFGGSVLINYCQRCFFAANTSSVLSELNFDETLLKQLRMYILEMVKKRASKCIGKCKFH